MAFHFACAAQLRKRLRRGPPRHRRVSPLRLIKFAGSSDSAPRFRSASHQMQLDPGCSASFIPPSCFRNNLLRMRRRDGWK